MAVKIKEDEDFDQSEKPSDESEIDIPIELAYSTRKNIEQESDHMVQTPV